MTFQPSRMGALTFIGTLIPRSYDLVMTEASAITAEVATDPAAFRDTRMLRLRGMTRGWFEFSARAMASNSFSPN